MHERPEIDVSYRNIRRITGPVLVSQISMTLMGVIDTIMVGRLGVTSLAAVGLGHFLSFWPMVFIMGMLGGVNVLVAQAVGAARPRSAGVAFWQGLYLGLILAAVLSAAWVAIPWVVGATGASPEVSKITVDYMQLRLLGVFGLALFTVAESFYRGLGRTRILMWCGLAQLVLNCAFNYLLIFGHMGLPRMEAAGSALGTIIAQMAVGLYLLGTILSAKAPHQATQLWSTWRFSPGVFRALVKVSLPTGIQYFLGMSGIIVFTATVSRLGDDEMAATNAVIQIWSLSFMAAIALSVGATVLVGQCIGAERPQDARLALDRVMRLGQVMALAMTLVYLAVPEALMSLFIAERDLERLLPFARPLFTLVVAGLLFDLVSQVGSGALRGSGDTTYPMWVQIGSSWLVLIPVTLVVTPVFGLIGAWCCLLLHRSVLAFFTRLRLRGSAWLRPPIEQAVQGA